MSVLAYQIDPSVSCGKFQASYERRLECAGEEKNPGGNVLEKSEKVRPRQKNGRRFVICRDRPKEGKRQTACSASI